MAAVSPSDLCQEIWIFCGWAGFEISGFSDRGFGENVMGYRSQLYQRMIRILLSPGRCWGLFSDFVVILLVLLEDVAF